MEGLWWADEEGKDFLLEPREKWNWKLIIRTPEFITDEYIKEAVTKLQKKGKDKEVNEVKIEKIGEGLSVQISDWDFTTEDAED